jgi:hypothetical protein
MASTSGSTTVEIIYCANTATVSGRDERKFPLACEQEIADRMEAFRVLVTPPLPAPPPTIHRIDFITKNPQGDDVYGAILIV